MKSSPKTAAQPAPSLRGNVEDLHWKIDILQRDPDFVPFPPAAVPTGLGSELEPHEREIVRRLLAIQRRQELNLSPEATLARLPKGIRLSAAANLLFATLTCLSGTKRAAAVGVLTEFDYWQQPPTMEEFLEDDYYLGRTLKASEGGSGLWPAWKTWLVQNATQDSFLDCVILTGAIGTGKTLVMVIMVLYRLCVCMHLRDPHGFYGLNRSSPIVCLLMSLSRGTLKSTAWATALGLMGSSRFFCEAGGFDPGRTYADLEVRFRLQSDRSNGCGVILSGGSKHQHQIGRNVLVAAMDEGNFRLERNPQQHAAELFGAMRARIRSRFQLPGGHMPGLSIVASSAGEESSFTERLINEFQSIGDACRQAVVRQAIYTAKPALAKCSWHFRVSYGFPNVEPAILRGCCNQYGAILTATPLGCPPSIAGALELAPDGARMEIVPGDFFDTFNRSPRRGLQEISGISLGGAHRLFSSMRDVEWCIAESVKDGVVSPMRSTLISVDDADARNIWDDLDHRTFLRVVESKFEPKRHPHRQRFVHLDLATTGMAGLAICHLAEGPRFSRCPTQSPASLAPELTVEYDFVSV